MTVRLSHVQFHNLSSIEVGLTVVVTEDDGVLFLELPDGEGVFFPLTLVEGVEHVEGLDPGIPTHHVSGEGHVVRIRGFDEEGLERHVQHVQPDVLPEVEVGDLEDLEGAVGVDGQLLFRLSLGYGAERH